MSFQDRVIDFKRIPASEINDNTKNWRKHPDRQRQVLSNVLNEIGFVGALVVRIDENGAYELLDGHLRKDIDGDQEVPVLITDLTEDEMLSVLETYDPITDMAIPDSQALESLLRASHAKVGADLQVALQEVGDRFGINLQYEFGDDDAPPDVKKNEYSAVQLIIQIPKHKLTEELTSRVKAVADDVEGKFLVKGAE